MDKTREVEQFTGTDAYTSDDIVDDLAPTSFHNLSSAELESLAVQEELDLQPLDEIIRDHRKMDSYFTGNLSNPVPRGVTPMLAISGAGAAAGEPNAAIPPAIVVGGYLGLKRAFDRQHHYSELKECKAVLQEYRVLDQEDTDDVQDLLADTDQVTVQWDAEDTAITAGDTAAGLYRQELDTVTQVYDTDNTADVQDFLDEYDSTALERVHTDEGAEEVEELLTDARITQTLRITDVDSDTVDASHVYAAEVYVGGRPRITFLGAADSAAEYEELGTDLYTGPAFISQCYDRAGKNLGHGDVIDEDAIPAIVDVSRDTGIRARLPF